MTQLHLSLRRRLIGDLGAGVVAAAVDRVLPMFRAQDAVAEAVAQPAIAPEKESFKAGLSAWSWDGRRVPEVRPAASPIEETIS